MNDRSAARAWWREPMMWLVVGAPLAVVVASVVTAGIAWHRADPVIQADTTKPPAVQARNHVATPPKVQP